MTTTKTPRQMVDELLRVGPYDWAPPIPRYVDPPGHVVPDWKKEYLRLLEHHTLETDVLLSVIREMRRRLVDDRL